MNSIQDRISAATRAAADTVRPDSIPPLRLPADGRARTRRGRSWAGWLAPAGAAVGEAKGNSISTTAAAVCAIETDAIH